MDIDRKKNAKELKTLELILKLINRYLMFLSPADKRYLMQHLAEVECRDVVERITFRW